MSRFPDVNPNNMAAWARSFAEVAQNDSDEQGRRIRILDGKTVKEYTSNERDTLVNPNVGAIIYNKNSGLFEGFDGNGWNTFHVKHSPSFTHQRTLGGRHL